MLRTSGYPDEYGDITAAIPPVAAQLDQIRETADFSRRLTQNELLTVSGLGERYYTKGREFELIRTLPIPQELHTQQLQTRARCELGLFPEIGRAWVAIDCDIYMWNYETNDDLAYFDQIQNTVVKLALARPKPGVFQGHINYMLIVATVVDISLFAVSSIGHEVCVTPDAIYKVDLENSIVNDIVATDNGRIFFVADDALFELEYTDSAWFGKNCKKINRSTNLLQSFIPFLQPVAEEILQVCIDRSRNILYTLSVKGSINVYDLGINEKTCTRVATMAAEHIKHVASQLTKGQHDPSLFSPIISISVIPAEGSHYLHLVGVTTKGVRLYFSVLPRQAQPIGGQYVQQSVMSQAESKPHTFRLCHVRFAPGLCPLTSMRDSKDGVYLGKITTTSIICGNPEGRFTVYAMSDLYHPLGVNHFVETITELPVNGPVWAIHLHQQSMCPTKRDHNDMLPAPEVHPFYRIHSTAPEILLLFTSEGLHMYQHRTPTILLREALCDRGTEATEIDRLWKTVGDINSLVLLLSLLSSEKPIDQAQQDKVMRLFHSQKDQPEMVDYDQGVSRVWNEANDSFRDWTNRMPSPLRSSTPFVDKRISNNSFNGMSPGGQDYSFVQGSSTQQFRASKRHDALYAYFARLVVPLWNQPLVQKVEDALFPLVSATTLNWMSHQLRLFRMAINDNNLIAQPTPAVDHNNMNAKFQAEAFAREHASLVSLAELVDRTLEALALWAEAVSHELPAVSASLDAQAITQLSGRRLSDLVTNDTHLNQYIIRGLIRFFLNDEAGAGILSERLRNVCPTLYSKEDALLTNAVELLDRARRSGPSPQTRKLVDQAVEYMKQSISKVPLPSVAIELMELKAYDSLVELAIRRAECDDTSKLAVEAFRNNIARTEINKKMADAVNRREDAYRIITRALEEVGGTADTVTARDQIKQAVLASDDELAHATLFRWMMHNGETDKILQSNSRYIEGFLSHEMARGGSYKYIDLLWKYFEKTGSYDKAATLLRRLAEDNTFPDITLEQRIAHLSHAIICAASASDPKIRQNIQELRDKLDVANVQLSAKQVLARVNTPEYRKIAAELDRQLFLLQDICERYIQPYGLHRVMLAAFSCANHYKEDDIQALWIEILEQEMEGSPDCGMENVINCLVELSQLYQSSNYFPTEFIITQLLIMGRDRRLPPTFYTRLMDKMKLQLDTFLRYLCNEFNSDRIWRHNEIAFGWILTLVEAVMERFIDNNEDYDEAQRLANRDACYDCIRALSINLKRIGAENGFEAAIERLDVLKSRLHHGVGADNQSIC